MCGADLSDIYEEDLKKEKKDSERKGTNSRQAFNINKDHSDNVAIDTESCFGRHFGSIHDLQHFALNMQLIHPFKRYLFTPVIL